MEAPIAQPTHLVGVTALTHTTGPYNRYRTLGSWRGDQRCCGPSSRCLASGFVTLQRRRDCWDWADPSCCLSTLGNIDGCYGPAGANGSRSSHRILPRTLLVQCLLIIYARSTPQSLLTPKFMNDHYHCFFDRDPLYRSPSRVAQPAFPVDTLKREPGLFPRHLHSIFRYLSHIVCLGCRHSSAKHRPTGI